MDRIGQLRLIGFDVEPDCWESFVDRRGREVVLKPDAAVRIRGATQEHRFFLEVDMGTESRPIVARKLRTYSDYFRDADASTSGDRSVSRVLLLTTTAARQAALNEVCADLCLDAVPWFLVGALDGGVRLLAERATA